MSAKALRSAGRSEVRWDEQPVAQSEVARPFQERSRAQSQAWCAYFIANHSAANNLPWDDPYDLSDGERRAIRKSIQQFQLGEGSEGRRLLDRGDVYSHAAGDPYFGKTLALFIKEEQRHSAQLLRFMSRQDIPRVTAHWVDTVFRGLRGLAGIELSLRVLVTAEIIAVPYYRALGRATRSKLLQAISDGILQDESAHLKFQASMLSRLARGRSPLSCWLLSRAQRLFLIGTCCIVWLNHRSVFAAAKYFFSRFLREAFSELADLDLASSSVTKPRALMDAGFSSLPVSPGDLSSAKVDTLAANACDPKRKVVHGLRL